MTAHTMAHGMTNTMEMQITESHTIVARSSSPHRHVGLAPTDIMIASAMPCYLFALFWPACSHDAEHSLLISLSAALDGYPSFVGRLQPGGKILCANQGMSVSCGHSPRSLSDFLPSGPVISPHIPIDLREFMGNVIPYPTPEDPLLSISIARLKCGALAILVTPHHLLGDTHSMRQFVRDWTTAAKCVAAGNSPAERVPYPFGRLPLDGFVHGLSASMLPSEPLGSSLDTQSSIWVMVPKKDGPISSVPVIPLSTLLIYFSKARLQELKAKAMQDILEAHGDAQTETQYVSSNDAMTARLRQVLASLPCRGPSKPTSFFFTLDQRERVETHINFVDQDYVGTCVSVFCTPPLDPSSATLGALSASTRGVINSAHETICKEYAWMTEQERRFGHSHLWTAQMGKLDFSPGCSDFGVTKWHFTQPVDFGFGPAVWMQTGLYLAGGEFAVAFPALHQDLEGGVFLELHASLTVIGELLNFQGEI